MFSILFCRIPSLVNSNRFDTQENLQYLNTAKSMKFKVASTTSVKTSKSKLRLRCLLPIFAASLIISMFYLYSYYTHYPNPIDSLSTIINENDETKATTSSLHNTSRHRNRTIVTDKHIDEKVLDTVAAYHSSSSNTPQRIKPTIIVANKQIGRKVDTVTTNPSSSSDTLRHRRPIVLDNRKVDRVETNPTTSSSTPQHGQPTEIHIDKTADKLEMNPKALDYLPLNGPLSKRPTSTLHPDSLSPKRTYNTEPPNLPPCHREDDKAVSIYIESQGRLNSFFYNGFPSLNSTSCNLPDGVKCSTQSADKYSDAVFRFVYFIDSNGPLRYCQGQTLIVFNSEALRGTGPNYQQLDLADFRIDQFLTSDAYWKPSCLEFPDIFKGQPPSDPAKRTKAVALFLSDCNFKWRNDYINEIMKYIHVDSYGQCFHNVPEQQSRYGNRNNIVSTKLQSYRMLITFENLIQQDYITEKIWLAYQNGAIPVYMGPPDIYDWVPGNHTFIDPRKFSSPKELAEYMKRVAEDDELFKYHTSNFEWDRTKRMMDKYCSKANFACRMCEFAYKMKRDITQSDSE